jgi:hypothetical protein
MMGTGTYRFACRALLLEACAYVAAAAIIGITYQSWTAIIGAQLLLLVAEVGGYWLEGWLWRRRHGGVEPW